jgi:iron complex outermembrane recepter protein
MQRMKSLACSVSALALTLGVGAAYAQSDQNQKQDQAMETVVVTGIRASLEKGLEIKHESTQIVEAVVAEDIGKLPDNNVVEALQRLTGVQVTNRASGQVGTLYIRGMPDVETTWNGRKMFTSSGLYFSVQDMPATMVRELKVYKTRAASQIETALGGQLEVTTYRPFDFEGFKFSTEARETYEENRGAFDPAVSALISDRWQTSIGDIGALVNLSYSVVRFRDESATPGALVPFMTVNAPAGWGPLERIFNNDARVPSSEGPNAVPIWQPGLPQGLSEAANATMNINGVATPYYLSRDAIFQSDFTGKRTRPNANIALQWAPDDKSLYTLEVMYNGYRQDTDNSLLFSFVDWWGDYAGATPRIDPASSFTLFPGTNIMKTRHAGSVYGFNSGDYTTNRTNSFVYALNAQWEFTERLKVVADASYQQSIFDTQFFALRMDRVAPDIYVDFNKGGGYLAFNFGTGATGQALLTTPSAWNTAQAYDNGNHNSGSAFTLQADGTYDLDGMAGIFQDVRFGVRYDDRRAVQWQRSASNWMGENLATFAAANTGILTYNHDFFGGSSAAGDVPSSWVNYDGHYAYLHRNQLRQLWGGQLTTPIYETMFRSFQIDEATTSAYLEGDAEQDIAGMPLKLNAGVRWVQVKDDNPFWDYNQFIAGNGYVETKASAYVAKWLPSATLSFEPSDKLKFVLNYGETLRRPDFTALNPEFALNADVTGIGYGSGTRGNPDLKPTTSKNLDLTAEWYFAPNSAIYVTGFKRDIEGLVVNENVVLNIPGQSILNSYNTNTFVINEPVNASKGHMKGVELGLVYFPDYLPWYFDGLGAQGSLTVLSSSQNIPVTDSSGTVVSQLEQPFFGVSPTSYNATLIYEKGPIGARLSYVWRSKFHYDNEAALFANPLGRWHTAESSLDLQLSYKVWDNFMMTFDAVNLLKGVQQQYYYGGGNGSPTVSDFGTLLISRSFSLGLRYSLN